MAVVRRVLPAPADAVYEAWLDPEALADWMCPRPARCRSVECDPRVGGRLRIDIEDSGVAFVVSGRYLTLERPRRLRFTWSCSLWPDPCAETVVTVTLRPRGGDRTLMVIEHALLGEDLVDRHARGWTIAAGQLRARLTSAVG